MKMRQGEWKDWSARFIEFSGRYFGWEEGLQSVRNDGERVFNLIIHSPTRPVIVFNFFFLDSNYKDQAM